jgi:MFS family permease
VWAARFLVQCGAALILFYLYVYLRQLPARAGVPPLEEVLSILATSGGLAGAAAVFALGRLSDRLQRRRWPTAASGLVAAAGLLLLASEPAWPAIILAYTLFSAGPMAFLALDHALVAQMLAGHPARGRWLGIMNLTNTLPAIATPVLTLLALQVASDDAVRGLLALLAAATAAAGLIILRVRSVA